MAGQPRIGIKILKENKKNKQMEKKANIKLYIKRMQQILDLLRCTGNWMVKKKKKKSMQKQENSENNNKKKI